MSGWLIFIYGFGAGGTAGLLHSLHVNNSWYRKARQVATSITNDMTAIIREAANHIPDPDLSASLKREADKCDEVWR